MDRLQAMKIFTKIVEMNSFSRAADSMALPHASATMIIKNLEAHLQVRLMQRTTRRLSITPEGAEYYERCVRILADIDETEGALAPTARGPRGKLKVDMPGSIGRLMVVPCLREFRNVYPNINLTITFGDKPTDLLQESVDCAIRVGPLQDSRLVARRLAYLPTITAASAEYIAFHGIPRSIDELKQHTAVHYFSQAIGRVRHMNFIVDGEPKEVKVPGTIAVSDAEAYVMCGINGLGLIQPARLTIDEQLQSGLMVPVLPQLQSAPMQVSAVYPHSRHLASTVRAFIEWTAKLFEDYALPSRGPKEAGIFSTKGEGGLAIKRAHSLLPAGESEVA